MATIKPAALLYGRRIILAGGYEFEVTSKYTEWLDVLEHRANAYPRMVEALRGALEVIYSAGELAETEQYRASSALLLELGEGKP